MMMQIDTEEKKEMRQKRDEWEIKDDIRATERFFSIMKDKERLKDMQEMIKSKKNSRDAIGAIGDGDLQKAIGFIS